MISKPWVSSAVTIWPSPWFHSCVTVLAKVASSQRSYGWYAPR